MKLEHGKYYLSREGKRVLCEHSGLSFIFCFLLNGQNYCQTYSDGRTSATVDNPRDIVKECPPLDFTKPLQTINGKSVEILGTNGRGASPIYGYIENSNMIRTWTLEGKPEVGDLVDHSLINVPKKKATNLEPKDIRPGDLIRSKKEIEDNPNLWEMVTAVKKSKHSKQFYLVAGSKSLNLANNLFNYQISHDGGKTWEECSKQTVA